MKKYSIYDTIVVPYIIAEQITENPELQEYLIKKTEFHYSNNKFWRKQFDKSSDAREFLKTFMEHWKLSKKALK